MECSTSTSINFWHREIAMIMVFYSMLKDKAQDQLIMLQHSAILWQQDMQNWWASGPLGLSLAWPVSTDSLGESLMKDFQHNITPCPPQQLWEIYLVWAFEDLSQRRWWQYSLWRHVHFMRPWDGIDESFWRQEVSLLPPSTPHFSKTTALLLAIWTFWQLKKKEKTNTYSTFC